jgi:hypothetical protein
VYLALYENNVHSNTFVCTSKYFFPQDNFFNMLLFAMLSAIIVAVVAFLFMSANKKKFLSFVKKKFYRNEK